METTEQNTVGRENADPGNALQILNHSLATEAADAVAIDLETEPQKKKKKSKPSAVSLKKIKLHHDPIDGFVQPEVRFFKKMKKCEKNVKITEVFCLFVSDHYGSEETQQRWKETSPRHYHQPPKTGTTTREICSRDALVNESYSIAIQDEITASNGFLCLNGL